MEEADEPRYRLEDVARSLSRAIFLGGSWPFALPVSVKAVTHSDLNPGSAIDLLSSSRQGS